MEFKAIHQFLPRLISSRPAAVLAGDFAPGPGDAGGQSSPMATPAGEFFLSLILDGLSDNAPDYGR